MHHTQCRLMKGNAVQMLWIPSKLAVVGKIIKIKHAVTGAWSEGWRVANVYSVDTTEAVEDRSQDYKRTRKASDI